MFQKFMDILAEIPHVLCYINDILMTGKDDAEHLANSVQVLNRLQQHGLRLKKNKYIMFMKPSVEYLGYLINAEGLHTTAEKLKAIVAAPALRNVSELRSFLGLLNYNGKFLSNVSTLLHPLNSLFQHERRWK